jgi:O-antigen/teichoic acid export membrane protein
VTLIAGIIATPLTLRWLGSERLGAFRAATDWLGYLGLFELGLGGALMPLFARALAATNETALAAALTAGFRSFRRVAGLMAVAGLILMLTISRLVPVDLGNHRDLEVGVGIGLLTIAFVPLSPLRWVADACQRSYFVNGAMVAQSLTITTGAVAFAHAGWGIKGQFAAVVIGGAIFQFLIWFDARRNARTSASLGKIAAKSDVDEAMREIRKLNTPTLILSICGRIGLLTDNIVIAFFISPAAVVPFMLTQRLAQVAQGQLQSVGGATWAALAELHMTGQSEIFNQRLIELTRFVTIIGLTGTIPIVCYNRSFVGLWIGPTQYGGDLLCVLAGLNAVLLAVLSLWSWTFSGTGLVAKIMPLNIIAVVINVVVSVVATREFGLPGPLIGTTVAFLGVFIWWEPRLLASSFGTSTRQLLLAVWHPVALALPFAGTLWMIVKQHPPRGWLQLGVETGSAAVLFAGYALLAIMNEAERRTWLARFRSTFA